jgi:hypothetical protein
VFEPPGCLPPPRNRVARDRSPLGGGRPHSFQSDCDGRARNDTTANWDRFICKLRKKLAHASDGKDYIETVWGRGYVLREPTEVEARISA